MYLKSIIRFVFSTVVILGCAFLAKEDIPEFVSIIIYIVVGIGFLDMLIAPRLRYERYRYILTEEEFEVRKGLIVVKTEIVPIERLHKIEVSSGPLFRAFGLKEVLATTAGGDVRVSFLEDETANQIAAHLKKRINTIAVEERNALEVEGDNEGK